MGFDLGGLAPENADGECFDTDISGWMPLAEYVLFTCEDIFLEGETECWFSNDGPPRDSRPRGAERCWDRQPDYHDGFLPVFHLACPLSG